MCDRKYMFGDKSTFGSSYIERSKHTPKKSAVLKGIRE